MLRLMLQIVILVFESCVYECIALDLMKCVNLSGDIADMIV